MFLQTRIKSFTYAFQGFAPVFKTQANILIHSLAAIVVIALGIFCKLTSIEWIIVIGAIGFVFVCEFFNSALETLADFVSPEKHEKIKKVKDISAAAVLISAITAAIIGCIIFIPKFID